MLIFDNHLHLRRDGRYIEAIKEFQQAGGTHCVLCQYPLPALVLKEKSYQSCYQETLNMASEIREHVDVRVYVTVGPYPVDYLTLRDHVGRERAIQIMQQGMDEAAHLCEEQKCIGIGEIGRPHFPVDEQAILDSNAILQYGMHKAKEVGAPVVLHTESTTPQQCKELVHMGREVGLPAEKIIKHFAPPLVTNEENYGLIPSVLASTKNIVNAIAKGSRFLMETDYIDDPKRPGAVLGPKTVPKVTKKLLAQGIMTEDQAHRIHSELPSKVYGIELIE